MPTLSSASRRDVTVVPWPPDLDLRLDLARRRVPRLLLVPAGAEPPELLDDLEDWVREGVDPTDLAARSAVLARRLEDHERPTLDRDGILRHRDGWTAIPVAQVAVVELLLERFGRVVTKQDLADAYRSAGGSAHPNSIRTLTTRLAARLTEVGLSLVSIRSRGVMLTVERAVDQA
jgi:hypothetical protein